MTDYKRLTFAISLILLVLVLVIPASAGEEPPSTDAMAVGGSLTIDSKLAEAGTIITAKSGDEVVGTVTVETGGIFGDEAWNKLYVKEPSGIGKITLYAELSSGSVVVAEGIDWSNADVQIAQMMAMNPVAAVQAAAVQAAAVQAAAVQAAAVQAAAVQAVVPVIL